MNEMTLILGQLTMKRTDNLLFMLRLFTALSIIFFSISIILFFTLNIKKAILIRKKNKNTIKLKCVPPKFNEDMLKAQKTKIKTDAKSNKAKDDKKKYVKTSPLQDGMNETVPLQQSGDETVPLQQSGDETVPLQQSGDETVPLQQSGDETVPLQQNRDETKPQEQGVGKNTYYQEDKNKTLQLNIGNATEQLDDATSRLDERTDDKGQIKKNFKFKIEKSIEITSSKV